MQSAYFTQRHQKVIRRTLTVTPSFEVILWRRTHRGVAALWDAPFTAQPICAVSRLNDLTTPSRLRNGWVVTPDTDAAELGLEFLVEWRSLSASESTTDTSYFRLDSEVLQWLKTLG